MMNPYYPFIARQTSQVDAVGRPLTTPPSTLSAVQYFAQLMNGNGASAYLSPAEFSPGSTGGSLATTDGKAIYYYHPLFSAPAPAITTVGALGLTPSAKAALDTAVGKALVRRGMYVGVKPDSTPLPVYIIGAALLLGGALGIGAILFGLLEADVVLASLGLYELSSGGLVTIITIAGLGLLIAGTVNDLISPSITNVTTSSNGGLCETICGAFGGGCKVVCMDPSTGAINTKDVTPPGPIGQTGQELLWLAAGVAAVAVVGIGTYAGYRYVQGRPIRKTPEEVKAASATAGRPGVVERVGHGAVSGVKKVGGAMKRFVAKTIHPKAKANPARTYMYSTKGMYGGRRRR